MTRARDIANQGAGTYGSITADDLTVDTTTLVVDDTNNRVGIGTSSPQVTTHIQKSAVSGADYDANDILTLENNGYNAINIIASPSLASSVVFSDDERARGSVAYDHTNNFMQFNVNAGEKMRISSGGSLSINDSISTLNGITGFLHVNTNNGNVYGINIDKLRNNTSGSGGIQVKRNEASGESDVIRVTNSGGTEVGSIRASNTGTSFNTTSDYRLKENLVDLTDGITRLKQLPVHRFNFISDPDVTVDGFLAHEAQEVVPEAVSGVKDAVDEEGAIKPQAIDQSKLVPLLTGALQEAIGRIETLEAEVTALEAEVTALKGA